MDFYNELLARGLVAQCTNSEKVSYLLNSGSAVFYLGIDPTADSLHVGSLVQLLLISRIQQLGNRAVCLFGGGTGMIGDPTGKNNMRRMMTTEEIERNISCFIAQASKFINISQVNIVNNAQWLCNLNYIEFLREVGIHFSINKMLAAECYKQRLGSGLTFFELNYMIMQSYDFLVLNDRFGCNLQIGGNDQWSNIISGVDLIKKKRGSEVYGLTSNLLTTSEGKKMGKTERGTLWLDSQKTSPYDFYQYWRNVADSDVITCFKMLTFKRLEEISEYEKCKGAELNYVKEVLAFEITSLVHGEQEAKNARESSEAFFKSGTQFANVPTVFLKKNDLKNGSISVVDLLNLANFASTKSEARRLIEQGGVSVNGGAVENVLSNVSVNDLKKGVLLKKGKKKFSKVLLIE
ncbi:MAG: tyrosine--tRNA ligase [Oscillospiraceae bacterium]|jgi:tyrosyl-tRNA synthetase|nr:tyrosine--tRNA ligase [Oscillospiraceae bacterium]